MPRTVRKTCSTIRPGLVLRRRAVDLGPVDHAGDGRFAQAGSDVGRQITDGGAVVQTALGSIG